MRTFLAFIFSMTMIFAQAANIPISQLPLGTASTTSVSDSFPYVDSIANITRRLTIWDIANIPTISGTYAPLLNPSFTGTISATGNITGANLSGTNTGDVTIGTFGVAPDNNGATLAAQVLTMQPADATHPGMITSSTQTIGGAKTFAGGITTTALSLSSTPLGVPSGGSGRSTLTDHGVLIGAGASAVTQLSAAAVGTLLAGAGASADPAFSSTPTLGIAGTTLGSLSLSGNTSGVVSVKPQAAAGTYNFNLPTGAGSSGQPLLSGGGGSTAMTFGALGPTYGGTGQDFSASTGALLVASGTVSAGTVGVTNGGTGRTTLTNHGVLLGAGTGAVTQMSVGATGTVLTGVSTSDPAFSATPVLGASSVATGSLGMAGTTSGTVTIKSQDAAGTFNFNLPTTAGTSGQVLTSGGGVAAAMTWSDVLTNPMTTLGDIIYEDASPAAARLAANATATNKFLRSVSSGAPAWAQVGFADVSGTADLTTQVTGALPVANGGTGRASLTNHGVLIGATTTAITQLAAAGAGTMLQGVAASDPAFSATPTVGLAGSATGKLNMAGTTSGTITIQPQDAAGTYNFNLPNTAGSSGQVLTSAAGGSSPMTWSSVLTNPMDAAGQMIYGGASGVATKVAAGTSGMVPVSSGTAVAFASLQGNSTALKAPTIQSLTSTGTTAGYVFTVTSANATVGATYTNNGNTYTVLATIAASTVLFTSQANAPQASGTLTKSAGTGDATITFSVAKTLAVYTTPSSPSPLYLKIKMAGGGGGGGGGGTIATSPTSGTAGTASRFGESLLAFCNGGAGGSRSANSGKGGAGGTASLGSASGLALVGGMGSAAGTSAVVTEGIPGGIGGSGPLGGAGSGDLVSTIGGVGATNTGAGGGGGGSATGTQNGGGFGGGAGGYAELMIPAPAASYYYTVGTGGANGAGGTSGVAGGSGGSGVIYVEEFYQ